MFFALSTNEAFWKERLNLYVALAPITRLDHTESAVFKALAANVGFLQKIFDWARVYSILGPWSSYGSKIFCSSVPEACQFAETFLITNDTTLNDIDRFKVYMGHFPAGASV